MLAVSMEVFPDCETLDCTVARNKDEEGAKGSGVLYDKLFVRHWDSWASGTRSQLYSVAVGNAPATTATWVSRGIVGDVPSKPFGGAEEYTFTPDGRSLIFAARIAGRTEPWSTNFDLYQAPADGSAAPRNLTADNPAWDTMPLVTPDGASLVYLAMQRPGFEADRLRIMVKDLATGQTREVAADWDRSPGAIALSADGKSLLAAADDLGQHPLFSIDLASGQVTKLTGAGHVSGFTVAGDSIILAQNALDRPDDLFRLSASGEMKQLTAQNAAKLSGIEMASYEQFSFDGAGGDRVYGYVMKPAGWSKDRKYPVAFLIHGGPQGSMGNNFHYRWNPEVFAGMGYGVVFIDFHGSTGYGQQFTDSISGDWGGKPLEDLKKGLAHALDEYPWLDGRRACALGASYGGFMVNWIAGNWPEGFRCLVTHDGIFDNRAMYYGTEELWFPEWEHQGPYYENPSAYEKHNPSAHVLKWKTPMLIIHGGQDFRVPVEQGLAAFTAAQRLGVPSEFLYFPDENHWVIKPQNSIQWYDTVQRWMDRWTAAEPR
jgi:dipeptidyl aminopeptidase/acylaminoacyl peptidase